MIATILINMVVTVYEQRLGLRLASPILIADSLHTRSDIYASLAVLVGLAGVKLGWPILDPVAAIVVVGLIARAGYRIVTSSLDVLADAVVYSPHEISATAMRVSGVLDCHGVRTRGLPDHVHLDFHLTIAPETPTSESHAIAHRVIEAIRLRFPGIKDVTPHVEPPDAAEAIGHHAGHGHAAETAESSGRKSL
jgi:cation diffusion facilitator family transporter